MTMNLFLHPAMFRRRASWIVPILFPYPASPRFGLQSARVTVKTRHHSSNTKPKSNPMVSNSMFHSLLSSCYTCAAYQVQHQNGVKPDLERIKMV